MEVSVRLFGISDLPYSMAGIRIFAKEERNNRIVIMDGMWDLERLNVAGFGILPYQVAISTTPRPFFFPLTTTGSLEIKEFGISTTHLLERTFGIGIRK